MVLPARDGDSSSCSGTQSLGGIRLSCSAACLVIPSGDYAYGPLTIDALELRRRKIVEGEAGSGAQVTNDGCHECVSTGCLSHDASGDVHRDSGDVVSAELNLSYMDAGPDMDSELLQIAVEFPGTREGLGW